MKRTAKPGQRADLELSNTYVRLTSDDKKRLQTWMEQQRFTPSMAEVIRVALLEFLDREES